ncbi:hypothetical protein CspeluHIS016_0702210 [Cutaneotrichosporon spelunceum]|uniref:N-terminal of MaoC-like dehydratase domain-containing protein n=1 Tax=Cutaneotrichosporon spelunceum TaxID=1672016 RepID=A0AAD3TZ42_9TREE|nr:hypothetical protein CspeluHIS016_0702210 [Cutaneotrichosporon spelunceum]
MLRQTLLRLPRPAAAQSRCMSSVPANVQKWIADAKARPPQVDVDVIEAGRAAKLHTTLPLQNEAAGMATEGSFLPKGHNLVYWQPGAFMDQLAADGTSTEYNAPEPYTRRMWAAGSWEWRRDAGLTVGGKVCQSTTVNDAEVKGSMMFVYTQRDLFDSEKPEGDWAIRETRTHVFFPEAKASDPGTNKPKKKPAATDMPKADYEHTFTPTSPLLFRYSALTWNAHKIHYDKDWTREVEGHPDLVVHGPLTAQLLVEVANNAAEDAAGTLIKFDYRATHPMYVNKPITLRGAWVGPRGSRLVLWAEQDGVVGMKGFADVEAV